MEIIRTHMLILLVLVLLCLCQGFTPSHHQPASRHHRSDLGRTITHTPVPLIPKHLLHRNVPATRLHVSAPEIVGVLVLGFAGWLYIDGADDRARRNLRDEENARYQQYQDERAKTAYIEPKEYWTEEELAQYDGTQDEDGPILLAADGLVFNVYKGRNFYGPGGEYHLFAGRDATRLLARTIVVEETLEEANTPLRMAERAALAAWMFTIKGKYEVVGRLEGFEPKTTSMKSLGQ